jgi:hypothetical protein
VCYLRISKWILYYSNEPYAIKALFLNFCNDMEHLIFQQCLEAYLHMYTILFVYCHSYLCLWVWSLTILACTPSQGEGRNPNFPMAAPSRCDIYCCELQDDSEYDDNGKQQGLTAGCEIQTMVVAWYSSYVWILGLVRLNKGRNAEKSTTDLADIKHNTFDMIPYPQVIRSLSLTNNAEQFVQ